MRTYQLDRSDKLIALDGDWDAFGSENGGPQDARDAYLGQPLWDFVTGFQTQSYLNSLFFFVRQRQQPITLGYRCDAPGEARAFSMRLEPGENSGVHASHSQLRIPSPRHSGEVTQLRHYLERPVLCSQCLKLRVRTHWVESVTLPNVRDFTITYDVCPSCREAAQGVMEPVGMQSNVVSFGR